MKRLFAIVILNIFLLNVLGSYAFLLGLKVNAAGELSELLDSDMYDLGETVTFKIPFTVPYGTDSWTYERIDGQFEKDGIVYRMVKQRRFQDNLYIVCVKDQKSTKINGALTELAKTFAGQEDNGDQKTVTPGFIKDYVSSEIDIASLIVGWQSDVIKTSLPRYFLDSYFASIVHPPDRLA